MHRENPRLTLPKRACGLVPYGLSIILVPLVLFQRQRGLTLTVALLSIFD